VKMSINHRGIPLRVIDSLLNAGDPDFKSSEGGAGARGGGYRLHLSTQIEQINNSQLVAM